MFKKKYVCSFSILLKTPKQTELKIKHKFLKILCATFLNVIGLIKKGLLRITQ